LAAAVYHAYRSVPLRHAGEPIAQVEQGQVEVGAAAADALVGGSPSHGVDGNNIAAAVALLRATDPLLAKAFDEAIEGVVIVDGVAFRSASHPHGFGVIFLSAERCRSAPAEIALSLVHELAHQELFLVNLIDRLVREGSDHSLLHAPYQGKERPPIGRLHSAHALWRMTRFCRALGWGERAERYGGYLRSNLVAFRDGELTEFATRMLVNVHRKAV
jgi:HEXXH motif-containing protein